MKIMNVRAMVTKAITVGLLAGAVAMAAPVKAEAQRFVVGVQVGYPHYGYYHPDYYAYRRHEDWVRHEEWARAHEYGRYHYDAPYRYR